MSEWIFWEHDYALPVSKMSNTEKYKEFELNDHGMLVFKHKTNKRLFLQRSYRWKDQLTLIDETEGRQIIMDFKFSDFEFYAWEPMTQSEFDRVESNYKEIYENQQEK